MERWVEYYSELYSRENIVSPSALVAIKCVPVMEKLHVDLEPTVEELSKTVDSSPWRGTRQ